MGDKGNIVVKDGKDVVYLYGHWSRSQMPQITRHALARKQRWSDAPYLTRVIFCELIGPDVQGESGFGISSTIGDGDETVIVDVDNQTVTIANLTTSFENFIKE